MPEVVFEVSGDGGTQWAHLGRLTEAEPPGSMTSIGDDGKDEIFVFGWRDGIPGVWISIGGATIENSAVRGVFTLGFDLVADLREGPCELMINNPKVGKLRWRGRLV